MCVCGGEGSLLSTDPGVVGYMAPQTGAARVTRWHLEISLKKRENKLSFLR